MNAVGPMQGKWWTPDARARESVREAKYHALTRSQRRSMPPIGKMDDAKEKARRLRQRGPR